LLGIIARGEGRAERAVQLFEKAVHRSPDDAAVLTDLGNTLKSLDRLDEAAERHERVVTLTDEIPGALSNLASTYVRAGRVEEAVALLERAASLAPGHAEIHYNLGNALLSAGRHEAATESLHNALVLSPDHIGARSNLGVALREQGKLDEAVEELRMALYRAPLYADAGWNLSLALLMKEDWWAGWEEYEWRRRISGFAIRNIDGEDWSGGDLDGRTLLVHAEQGLGDSFQFARYLPLLTGNLADKGGTVIFAAQDPLVPILAQSAGMPKIIGASDPIPDFDVQAPLMSLPHLLNAGPPVIPDHGPWLTADSDRVARWRGVMSGPEFKIGIAWQGNAGYKADRQRSIALSEFAPIAALPGIHLYSLQQGAGADQLDTVNWTSAVTRFGPEWDTDGAFLDTAAIMKNLDLVITSDTSIAHLAGALGVETWLALAHIPDWRWGLTGDTTPWYPWMNLYRQKSPGDWTSVFSRISVDLERRIRKV
jgi:Flp pilus assembly protein TadD